jgi:anti-sigma B factor antagonist
MAYPSSSSRPSSGDPVGLRAPFVVIEADIGQEVTTVVIAGELDLNTRPLLAEHLSAVLAARPRRLILDMSGTRFTDCSSARMIVSAGRFLPAGGRLIIRRPTRAVRRVLEVTGYGAGCEIENEDRA